MFEVSSVRPNEGKVGDRAYFRYTGSGLVSLNNTLIWLVQDAYGIFDPDMISNAPDWIKKESFDIEAKVSNADAAAFSLLTRKQKDQMLQPVLEDRFRLKCHVEPKMLPVFVLTVAPKGPHLLLSHPDETGKYQHLLSSSGGHQINAKGIKISETIFLLANFSRRTVVDKTNLTDRYDFDLHWVPQDIELSNSALDNQESNASLFTALKEQLGLELKPGKAPLDTLVIDHIERPLPN